MSFTGKTQYQKRRQGFTLIEIMIVVVIVGILGAVVVQNIIGRPDEARRTTAAQDIRTLAAALDVYRLDNLRYPTSEQGLEALVSRPTSPPEPRGYNPEGYIRSLPEDPWGYPYEYEFGGTTFELWSYGADGEEGGEGINEDIAFADL